jgi:hypothetical protein
MGHKGSVSRTIRLQSMNATPGRSLTAWSIGNSSRAAMILPDGLSHDRMRACGARDTAASLESRKVHDDSAIAP